MQEGEYMKQRKESQEELQFKMWLDEAYVYRLVERYVEQPIPFDLISKKVIRVEQQLKTKVKQVERHVCASHVYTADFYIGFSMEGCRRFSGVFQKTDILGFPRRSLYVDTKGSFMNRGATGEFAINQKLVYDRYKIWVAKVVKAGESRCVSRSMVTCRSCMACSRADCVLAGARLISSASRKVVNSGPRTRLNSLF